MNLNLTFINIQKKYKIDLKFCEKIIYKFFEKIILTKIKKSNRKKKLELILSVYFVSSKKIKKLKKEFFGLNIIT
ncbi:MAG: hypothetical protein LBF97_06580, partial [Elusimicrobiota bacterium]|nr:hypothetical protein [Elusimicrobiota bacterium]